VRVLVTGAAGFIGSTLVDQLLCDGHEVIGVDCFTDYYDPERKRAHIAGALRHHRFELRDEDLADCGLATWLRGVDVVYHLAGQPGVHGSWGSGFSAYLQRNIHVTQLLLEASAAVGVGRFVYASSSSVYGEIDLPSVTENSPTVPLSPYGVTKLAAEQLCRLYARERGVPVVALRYFTVYGPRQRPDMAASRLIAAALFGGTFQLFGDGSQVRDFTYVDDVVAGTIAAGTAPLAAGTVLNLAGGKPVSLNRVIDVIGMVTGREPAVHAAGARYGDVTHTGGVTARARELLGWSPRTSLAKGLREQVDWMSELLRSSPPPVVR